MKLILTFTTGRSGTAFLSQAFGGSRFEKNKVHQVMNGKSLVTHESWKGVPVLKLKQETSLTSSKASEMVKEYLDRVILNTKKEYFKASKYLVTDHRVGRYCIPSIGLSDIDYKIIRIFRNHKAVAKSLKKRVDKRKSQYNKDKFLKFYNGVWKLNLYHPKDKFIIKPVFQSEWERMGIYDKFLWYSEEVERQWQLIKENFPKDKYMEIDFDKIITPKGLDKVEGFIGIPWSKEWATVRANR